jgi:hypothetical protein
MQGPLKICGSISHYLYPSLLDICSISLFELNLRLMENRIYEFMTFEIILRKYCLNVLIRYNPRKCECSHCPCPTTEPDIL